MTERLITVVGLAASVGLAVIAPLVARDQGTRVELILGLTGFLVGYLLTMDVAARARLRALEDSLQRRLEEVERSRYGALPLQRLLSVPDIEESIRDVVSAAADARAKRMQFLANRTIERIKQDREETLQIAQGVFRCADRREELRLVRCALLDSTKTLKAVAGLGLASWRTPEFREYFETYLEFADRLEQTRLFLIDPLELAEPEMLAILERHADAGVRTWALDKTALPSELCRPFVLFDEQLLLLHTVLATGGSGIDVHFTDDFLRVRDAQEDFDSLMRRVSRRGAEFVIWPPPTIEHFTATPAS